MPVMTDRARARIIDSRLAIASSLCLMAAAHIGYEEFGSAEAALGRARTAAQDARTLAEAGKNKKVGETSFHSKLLAVDQQIFELQASLSHARLQRR